MSVILLKKPLLILSLICFNLLLFAQNNRLDSLKNEVRNYEFSKKKNTKLDTTAVNDLMLITKEYLKINLDSCYLYNQKAVKLSKEVKWKYGEAVAVGTLAEYYSSKVYDFEKSIPLYQDAIKTLTLLYPKTKGDLPTARYYEILGNVYKNLGQYDNALNAFNSSLEIRIAWNDKNIQINSHNSMGNLYRQFRKPNEALTAFFKGLELADELNHTLKKSILIGNIALVYDQLNDKEKAIEYYLKAIELDTELNNIGGLTRHYGNMGNLYRRKGEFIEARENYDIGLALTEQTNDKRSWANLMSNKAILLNLQGEYSSALENNMKALDVYTAMNDFNSMSNTMISIGVDYQYSGNMFKALSYFQKAFDLGEKYKLPNLGASLGNISLVLLEHGSYDKALALQFEIIDIQNQQQDEESLALSYGNMGSIFEKQKSYDSALFYQEKSYHLAEKLELKLAMANSLSSIGNLYLVKQENQKGLEQYIKAGEIYSYLDAKNFQSINYSNISDSYYRLGNASQALLAVDSALYFAALTRSSASIISANKMYYKCHIQNNDLNSALISLSNLRKEIDLGIENNYLSFNEAQRESYFNSIDENLSNYYDFGVKYCKEYPEMADTLYNLALRNKGLALKSSTFIRQAILSSGDSILINEYNDFVELKKSIVNNITNQKDVKEQEIKASTLEKEIIKRSGVYSDFNKLKKIEWTQVRDGLKSGEAAIEFVNYVSETDSTRIVLYAALVVTKNSIHPSIIELCTETQLHEILGNNQGSNVKFVNKIYGTSKKHEKALYDLIWAPIEEELKNINKIYYSPIGLLHKVSFVAINSSSDLFLCDSYQLIQQGSTGRVLNVNDHYFEKKDKYLLIGGVDYNEENTSNEIWKYLPGTEKETQSIDEFLNNKNITTTYLTSKNATEESIKKLIQENEIIHLSTHGFFFSEQAKTADNNQDGEVIEEINFRATQLNDTLTRSVTKYAMWSFVKNKNPLMRSGLVFSGGNNIWQRNDSIEGEDGILTAQEIANLDLRSAKLVVLSACETGLGDIKGNEGVFGLQRSFKMAGAKYIIMTLWQVPDKETAEFMELFYKNFIKLNDVKEAFSKTQNTMRKKYDPYYWAAFILTE